MWDRSLAFRRHKLYGLKKPIKWTIKWPIKRSLLNLWVGEKTHVRIQTNCWSVWHSNKTDVYSCRILCIVEPKVRAYAKLTINISGVFYDSYVYLFGIFIIYFSVRSGSQSRTRSFFLTDIRIAWFRNTLNLILFLNIALELDKPCQQTAKGKTRWIYATLLLKWTNYFQLVTKLPIKFRGAIFSRLPFQFGSTKISISRIQP